MVEREDDSFLQQFMARAKERQAKLAQIGTNFSSSRNDDGDLEKADVSYPALSPLPEEGDTTLTQSPDNGINDTENTTNQQEQSSLTEYRRGNYSPASESELNYSSDLSLECDTINSGTTATDEVYRAEPVLCHSPDQQILPPRLATDSRQPSPRKTAPSLEGLSTQYKQTQYHSTLAIKHNIEQPAPLHERQQEQKATSSQSLPNSLTEEQMLKDFKKRIEQCDQRKSQLKKAVEVPKYGSKEHIEAAKLLQITDHEHLAYTNHVAMLEKGLRKKSDSLGSLKLTDLKFRTSERLINELADPNMAHHFFCIASCGTDVRATEMVNTRNINSQASKKYIEFKDKISFVDLPPDFVVKLEIFELIIGQQHLNLLSRLTPSKKSRITPEANFKRVGSLRLTLADRDVSYKNIMQWSKHEESKYLMKECKFKCELRPEQLPSKGGMLDVRCLDNNNRPDWSRFWVDLSGGQIRFWKSKQDMLDGKKPNQLLEMRDLCSEFAQKLDPNDGLYRPSSFLIYTFQQVSGGEGDTLFQRIDREDSKFKVVRHQLAAENKEDRDSWCSLLDRSMHSFREWHGKGKVYLLEDLKEIFSSPY